MSSKWETLTESLSKMAFGPSIWANEGTIRGVIHSKTQIGELAELGCGNVHASLLGTNRSTGFQAGFVLIGPPGGPSKLNASGQTIDLYPCVSESSP